jgi:hypothetical protein
MQCCIRTPGQNLDAKAPNRMLPQEYDGLTWQRESCHALMGGFRGMPHRHLWLPLPDSAQARDGYPSITVALTRVDIRAPALVSVRRTGWERPWAKASAAPRRPVQGLSL